MQLRGFMLIFTNIGAVSRKMKYTITYLALTISSIMNY